MGRQRSMTQIKQQDKPPEKELNKMEASNQPGIEFKTIVIWMLKEISENFNNIKEEIEDIKNNQSCMKNKISEMKIH